MHGSVMIDGLELHGANRYGECIVTDLNGWRERPGVKSQDVSAANADGDVVLPAHNAARKVTITGKMIPKSPQELQEWTDRVNGLLQGSVANAGDQLAGGRLQVEWFNSTRWAPVRWDGELDITYKGTRRSPHAVFTIPLRAPKPQKFGDVRLLTVPASLAYTNVFHRGNTLAYPVVVVSGSAGAGYTMRTVGGTTYTVTRPLINGTPHTIDMRNGRLMVGGAYVSGGVSSAGIWRVGPGALMPVRIQPLDTGSPVMTITTLDTFI